jgi:hypothetical protein
MNRQRTTRPHALVVLALCVTKRSVKEQCREEILDVLGLGIPDYTAPSRMHEF